MKKNNCINCGAEVTTKNSNLCDSCGEIATEEWFDYIGTIESEIKTKFGKKETFCKDQGYRFGDFGNKLRTVQNKLNWLNEFLMPLELEIEIKPKNKP
ncbi:hypothetical protein [uncultured Draconibacterium sp.]|uniref:hypothetical protein n=1 Tax=uncultured Draconibacterium sp. TaxID=1573823 RepID=UPI0025F4566A|nr:hypothetical protein [uncultured Draconibacterium sp.]